VTVEQEKAASGCPVTGNRGAVCPVARGPKGAPVIGVAATYFRDPPEYTLRMQQEHGSMVAVSLPKPFVQVTEPDAIERVLRTNPDNTRRGQLYNGFFGFMGRGLLTLNHEEWRVHRRAVQPAFAPVRVEADSAEALPATRAILRRWETAAHHGSVVDIAPDVMDISTRTMGQALLGRDLSMPGLGYARAAAIASRVMYTSTIYGINELLPGFLPTTYQREKRWAHKVLNRIIDGVLAERRRTGQPGVDAAGLLLASGLPDQAVKDNLRTLLLAGTDTTGQALAWTLYEIARHPHVRAEIEDEVDRVLCGGEPTPQLRERLPVVRSAIEEAIRLHPPVWQFPRDLIEGEELAGRSVPANTTVLLSTYGTHRSPEHWADPESYDPSRFRDESAKTRHRFAYFPFGGGRRMCIGKNHAMATMITAVAMISQRFRLQLASVPQVRPAAFITMYPADGVHAVIRERG
jgi:cytochrome P450